MSERDDRPGWDRWEERDDWFAEPEPGSRPAATEEIWLDDAAEKPPTRRRPASVGRGRLAVGAAGLVALLVLVLWVAGVFGGGGKPSRTASTTTRPAATTKVRTPAPPTVRPPATTLAPGSSGAQVKRLQRALAHLGYSPGRIDGSYGPATVAALKRFQRATRLQPDGVLGPKTLRALKAKLAAR